MSIMDMTAFTAAFNSHKTGSTKFTRRMAIAIARMDGTSPGGITQDHIREAGETTAP